MQHRTSLALLVLVLGAAGQLACRSSEGAPAEAQGPANKAEGKEPEGTPVQIARVERATLDLTVTGPGRTDALEQQKVRAPFKGILRELRATDGDVVREHQILAVLVSRESDAALTGARALLRSAQSAPQRGDAERAVELARKGMVQAYLRAPKAGVVVSHGADEGALVEEAQDVLSLAAADSFVFRADIAQTQLAGIRRGEKAQVLLSARPAPFAGVVHGVLPAASQADLTAPVRIDLGQPPHALGLFGTAVITVGERRDVSAVPQGAILRDDVSGVQRLALVQAGKAHWIEVATGAVQGGKVEVTQPALQPGAVVIVSGQVGLPEGAQVQVGP